MPYQEMQSVAWWPDGWPSWRTRVVIAVFLWVIGIPLLVGLWFWMSWWGLPVLAGAVWLTLYYVKHGDK